MSNDLDKIKNSRRRQKDENAIAKQVKIAKDHAVDSRQLSTESHRYHKKHAMDCGNPECYLCGNPRKTHKDKLTQQEKSLFQDLDSQSHKHRNGLPDQE